MKLSLITYIFVKKQIPDGMGACIDIQGQRGPSRCYNLVPYNDVTSSFYLYPGETGARGLRVYEDLDCLGATSDFITEYQANLGAFDNRVSSCMFSFLLFNFNFVYSFHLNIFGVCFC